MNKIGGEPLALRELRTAVASRPFNVWRDPLQGVEETSKFITGESLNKLGRQSRALRGAAFFSNKKPLMIPACTGKQETQTVF